MSPIPEGQKVRDQLKNYLKMVGVSAILLTMVIFCVFSIYWGSLYNIPASALPGLIVDFDGGLIGRTVVQTANSPSVSSPISWTIIPASQFVDALAVAKEVYDERTWVAIAVNFGATQGLQSSLVSPDASYNGSRAITVFATESRNENAFRNIIRPAIQKALDTISREMALQVAQQLVSNSDYNITRVLQIAPQTVLQPVSYQLMNLAPFDQPVASAAVFVGLIFQIILAFFLVMASYNAREASGLQRSLSGIQLIALRLGFSFVAYFLISLFYSLLSLAFKLNVSRNFGRSGFLLFWMLNYVGMLALGLALESMVTVLTARYITFFMLTWIIANVSVCTYPLEVLPVLYHYGKGAPFYNISKGMRAVIFGTKNQLGLTFGVLITWVAISCITLPVFHIWAGRRARTEAPDGDGKLPRNATDVSAAS